MSTSLQSYYDLVNENRSELAPMEDGYDTTYPEEEEVYEDEYEDSDYDEE